MATARPGDLGRRLSDGPLLGPDQVRPSHPGLEVAAVLNPAAALVDGEVVLLLRVAERPRLDVPVGPDAQILDVSGPQPTLRPIDGHASTDLVPLAVLDPRAPEPRVVVAYLPKDLPGLDLSDPRAVSFQHPTQPRRVSLLPHISHLRVARSRDGIAFTVDPEPAIAPASVLEEYGCEDARATCIDGLWHVTYVSVSRLGITTSLATTRDFRTFTRHGVIVPPDHKDVALFPEKRAGGFMALTRPMPSSFDQVLGIWIALPDGQVPWGRQQPLLMPRPDRWDHGRTGAATVPFRIPEGWLEIYHGVDADLRYTLGAALLAGDDPATVLARSAEPILEPLQPFERDGLLPNVVFACGHVPLDDGPRAIRVYYGAADSCIGAADLLISDILSSLEPV
jgi:predicted GH43/DUF377 family glycosyl hydrolase